MKKVSKAMLLVFALALVGLVLPACSGGAQQNNNNNNQIADQWWNEPGNLQVRGYKAAFVGSANVVKNIPAARRRAVRAANEQIAAFIKTEIRALAEDWAKETGDLNDKSTLSSLINSEEFRQQYTKQALSGTTPLKYHKDGDVMYVLVGLKVGDFAQQFANNAKKKLDTMMLTDALKGQMRDRLNKLVEKEEKKLEDSSKRVYDAESKSVKKIK